MLKRINVGRNTIPDFRWVAVWLSSLGLVHGRWPTKINISFRGYIGRKRLLWADSFSGIHGTVAGDSSWRILGLLFSICLGSITDSEVEKHRRTAHRLCAYGGIDLAGLGDRLPVLNANQTAQITGWSRSDSIRYRL